MHWALGAGRKEGADGFVGFDLGEKKDFAAHFDAKVCRFASVAHQLIHGLPGAFHDLGPPQKGSADPKGPGADVPDLPRFFDLDHAMALQGDQRTKDCGDGLPGFISQLA